MRYNCDDFMNVVSRIQKDLRLNARSKKARELERFFKTGKGEYAEGDRFIGVMVPDQRVIAQTYCVRCLLSDIKKLLSSPIHEERLTALLILVEQYKKATIAQQKQIHIFYLAHTAHINNWDLVDLSADKIVGEYFTRCPKREYTAFLKQYARSRSLWERRIAVLTTFAFIKKGDVEPVFFVARMLLADQHDLIHKAVGWMLREAGKKNIKKEREFLYTYAHRMPRTMLRYAIEKMGDTERKRWLTV